VLQALYRLHLPLECMADADRLAVSAKR